MTPDRLRGWLERNCKRASTLQLSASSAVDGDGHVFKSWPLQDLPDDLPDIQEILDCCGDYADAAEEQVRCVVEFLNEEGETIARTVHKASTREAKSYDAQHAGDVSERTIVNQLLRHIEVQQRVLSGGNLHAFQICERVLNVQQKMMDRLATQNAELHDQLSRMRAEQLELGAGGDGEEDPVVSAEESRARARAWDKVAELAPIVVSTATRAAAAHFNGGAPSASEAAE